MLFVGRIGASGSCGLRRIWPELGFDIRICRNHPDGMRDGKPVSKGQKTQPAQFTRGYGLVFGQSERKAIFDGAGGPGLAGRKEAGGEDLSGAPAAGRREFVLVALATTSSPAGFLGAYQAAALRRFPGRTGTGAQATARGRGQMPCQRRQNERPGAALPARPCVRAHPPTPAPQGRAVAPFGRQVCP